jgi:hypothetical protein
MASPHISKFRFVSDNDQPLDAPLEWTPCRVEIDADPESLADLELFRGEERLEIRLTVKGGVSRITARWPRAGAGSYRLRLKHPGGVEARDCYVRPQKLTQEAFAAMLVDLQRRLPATIAIALQRAGALAGLTFIDPQDTTLAEELNRLTRACMGTDTRAGLSSVLRAVARQPHQVLDTVDVWSRRERARRIDPPRLHQAFARQSNLTTALVPLQVPEKCVEHSVDVYENRLLRTFFDQLNMRVRALHHDASKSRKRAVAARATVLLDGLTRARCDAAFLDDVSELSEPPARLTMVLLGRSEYRAALDGFLEFRRSVLVELEEPLLAAPLTNLPKLYESWGTLEVIATFLSVARALGYKVEAERLIGRSPGRIWIEVLKDGKPAVELTHSSGRRAKLVPQRKYSTESSELHSISFGKVPDVAIEIEDADGSSEIWIFDPKYKLDSEVRPTADSYDSTGPQGGPKPQDINAMHAYRDAIRDGSGRRVVRFAAILYPGSSCDYADGSEIAAVQAQPQQSAALSASLARILKSALDPNRARPAY